MSDVAMVSHLVQVVFLGNGRSGKTSMLRTLAKKPLQPDQLSTRGVTVDTFAGDLKPGFFTKWHHGFDLELSFWDFAGQLEYSAAHDFFMSTRQAVYVIVYSVLDDDESVMQQLLHWLSVVPEPAASPHVRLMIVGTKIDLVLASELQAVLQCKRSVVRQVVEARGLVHKILGPDVLFVSSLQSFSFESPDLNLTWAACRRALKDRMYYNCANIFDCQDLQQQQLLKFPKECKDMKYLVEKLKKKLRKKQALLCCKLDHEDAIKVLSKILETKDKDQRKLYFNVDLVNMALDILNDLGIIVLYGGGGSLHALENSPVSSTSDSSASPIRSICLEPQFLPGIMSLLVDPQTRLPAVTTVGALINLMEKNSHISLISRTSPVDVKYQLLELLESVGIMRRYRDSESILVPLALRGRPVSWSQIIRTASRTLLLGWRLGVSATAFVPAAFFMKLMLAKCADAERMWGCAFAYDVFTPGARGGASFLFVRLREDRRGVDVVAVMDEGQGSHDIVQREVDNIARMLGKDFNSASKRMHLCPMCCSTDVFVRSGAVHAFHLQQVAAVSTLRCSRYHDVSSSDVVCGKLTKLDAGSLPIVYPSRIHELKLPWMLVAAGGILSLPAHREPYSKLESNEKFCSGTFLATSFFVLTGQVATGDVLHSDEIQRFNHIVTMCRNKVASSVHMFRVNDFNEIQMHFRYKQGDTLAILGYRKIQSIHPVHAGDDMSTTLDLSETLDSFSCTDSVVVIFEKQCVESRSSYILFPGESHDLLTCHLTPAVCNASTDAACCWSELQDYFSVVMGPEFQNYEITAMTLFHNEERARAFMRQVAGMQKRQRSAVPPWKNRGRLLANALAEMGDEFAQYSEQFEQDQFDWSNSCSMDDKELKNELESFGIRKMQTDQVLVCIRQLQYTFEAQEATMRHLKDHTAAFGLLPPEENVDVNLTLAWWGNSKGNAV
jgi:GTPase SAR1 family protein